MVRKRPVYDVRWATESPELRGDWDSRQWKNIDIIRIGHFRKEGSSHRPRTLAKVLYTKEALWCIFNVHDKYVRCVHSLDQSEVWKDSCVEMFLQPNSLLGYFNVEINCGGALRCQYNQVSMIKKGMKITSKPLSPKVRKHIAIYHSLSVEVNPEIQRKTNWIIECKVPFTIFEPYVGNSVISGGEQWKANFYKCGDETSHPHWAAWSEVKELNFHRPQDFGTLCFERKHEESSMKKRIR